MNGLFSGAAARAALRSAHACLEELMSSVGTIGIQAMTQSPGLLATVDQHVAGRPRSSPGPTGPGSTELHRSRTRPANRGYLTFVV